MYIWLDISDISAKTTNFCNFFLKHNLLLTPPKINFVCVCVCRFQCECCQCRTSCNAFRVLKMFNFFPIEHAFVNGLGIFQLLVSPTTISLPPSCCTPNEQQFAIYPSLSAMLLKCSLTCASFRSIASLLIRTQICIFFWKFILLFLFDFVL